MVRSGGAHSDGQVDAIMANVADDVVTFDVVDPLRRTESWRRSRTAAWLEAMTVPSA
jgi:ketosteroid isomerase-like protein